MPWRRVRAVRRSALRRAEGQPRNPGKSTGVNAAETDYRWEPSAEQIASANLTLTPAEKETIRRWIAEGARYEEH